MWKSLTQIVGDLAQADILYLRSRLNLVLIRYDLSVEQKPNLTIATHIDSICANSVV